MDHQGNVDYAACCMHDEDCVLCGGRLTSAVHDSSCGMNGVKILLAPQATRDICI